MGRKLFWLSVLKVRRTDSCVILHHYFVFFNHQAMIDPAESVQGMLKVMSSLTEKQNGAFLDYEGQTIPW